jgi:Zn-dependent peptidase ImmA (M78 family)
MAKYFTKGRLYDEVHKYKAGLGLGVTDYGFNMVDVCINDGIMLKKLAFQTKALRGMAAIGSVPGEDVILLNQDRSDAEQNLDCGHEFVHLCIHRDIDKKIFNCIDSVYAKQDVFLEWQANEGAAEIIIPYQALLPLIKADYDAFRDATDIMSFKDHLSSKFNVTFKVIEYRIESLKYEIDQYINGTSLSDIKILSNAQQQKQKIYSKSLNDLEAELYLEQLKAWHDGTYGSAASAYYTRCNL